MINKANNLKIALSLVLFSFLFSFSAFAQQTTTPEEPITEITKNGEKIPLFRTDTPGIFSDKKGREWLFIKEAKGLADLMTSAREHTMYQQSDSDFVLSTPESLTKFSVESQLSHGPLPGVFNDQRGEQWILVPDKTEPENLRKGSYVRLEKVTPDQMMASMAGTFNFKDMIGESFKSYGPEQVKFSAALLIVHLTQCYGGFNNLLFHSSVYTPTCLSDFVNQLLTPQGLAGFYFFILTNRISTNAFMQVALAIQAYKGKTIDVPMLKARIAPFLGYIGMALGSVASSSVAYALSPPSWDECIKLVSEPHDFDGNIDPGYEAQEYKGWASQPCIAAFTHFLSVGKHLQDTPGETIEMITAGVAAAVTHRFLATGANFIGQGGIRLLGMGATTLAETGSFGMNTLRVVQVVSNLTIVSGVPGLMVAVVKGMTTYILFVAWDAVLKDPMMSTWHSVTTGPQISDAITTINKAVVETEKLNFEQPYIVEECQSVSVPPDAPVNPRSRPVWKKVCKNVSPLDVGLAKLRTSAHDYRKNVLLGKMDEAASAWGRKGRTYLNRYRATKMIVEYIHQQKDKKITTDMDVWQTAVYYSSAWRDALRREVRDDSPVKIEILSQLDQIDALVSEIEASESPATEDSVVNDLRSLYYYLLDKVNGYMDGVNQKQKLKDLLISTRKYIDANVGHIEDSPIGLGVGLNSSSTPIIYRIFMEFAFTDFNALKTTRRTTPMIYDNSIFINDLIRVVGEQPVYDSLYDLFCSGRADFETKNLNADGWEAYFAAPFLLTLSNDEQYDFYQKNCTEMGNTKLSFTEDDFYKTWRFKDRTYTDPLSLAMDNSTALISGKTASDAFVWWRTTPFEKTMELVLNSAITYETMIKRELLYHIPDVTPEELIASSAPTKVYNRGGSRLSYNIGSESLFGRPTLAQSLMAQTLYVLDVVNTTRPGDAAVSAKTDEVALAMARLILSYRQVENSQYVFDLITHLIGDLGNLNLTEDGASMELKGYEDNLKGIIMSSENRQSLLDNMLDFQKKSDELYKMVSGVSIDSLGVEEMSNYGNGLSSEALGKLSNADYKKYMYYKLLHENLYDIAISYLTLDLYKKLSLQPLVEINQESL